MKRSLDVVFEGLAHRARITNEAHPFWPCRAGCDGCCRKLADVPHVSRAEWELLAEGIAALAPGARVEVEDGLDALAASPPPEGAHVICPMLDRDRGECRVYAHRPAACRSYGYYVRRLDVLACELVVGAVESERAEVVWGNHVALEDDLARGFGEARPVTAWWREASGRVRGRV